MYNWIYQSLRLIFCPKRRYHKAIVRILGFYPKQFDYYELAFIHRSASKIGADGSFVNNERLEYLGDAILSAITAEFLFEKYPLQDEGFLTQMRSKMVNREILNKLAVKINLQKLIIAHTNNSISKVKSINGDTFEAFIGAIYLDRGYKKTKQFIIKKVIETHLDLDELVNTDTNYKSQLIEWSQRYKRVVSFKTNAEQDNSKIFICNVQLENSCVGTGSGKSKKEAEQNAAKATMVLVLEKKLKKAKK